MSRSHLCYHHALVVCALALSHVHGIGTHAAAAAAATPPHRPTHLLPGFIRPGSIRGPGPIPQSWSTSVVFDGVSPSCGGYEFDGNGLIVTTGECAKRLGKTATVSRQVGYFYYQYRLDTATFLRADFGYALYKTSERPKEAMDGLVYGRVERCQEGYFETSVQWDPKKLALYDYHMYRFQANGKPTPMFSRLPGKNEWYMAGNVTNWDPKRDIEGTPVVCRLDSGEMGVVGLWLGDDMPGVFQQSISAHRV